jgi:vesicle coat complex subunit
LKELLLDSDPYVRKTAVFCVAKLYDHDRELVEKSDLIDRLNTMLRDDNPTVVASALASLMDIWERSDAIKLTIDYGNASKMVQILPDCSEYVFRLVHIYLHLTFQIGGAKLIFSRH